MIYFLDNSLQLQKIVTSKNVISAIHEHELNGLIRADVELDLSYANKFLVLGIDHVGYYYKDEFYLHKIQRVEYDHVNESAKVVLRHIFFEDMIFGKLIQDVRPQNQDALTVSRQTIDANTRWQTIMTDVTGQLSTNFYWQVPYEVIEFMTKNYRIEYLPKILFDGQNINGFQLHLANKIGEDKNIRIPYGSRVLDLKYEEDYSEIITKLVVHGKGEEIGDGYGRRINISDVNFSRNGVESPVGSLYLEDETITNTYGNDGQTPREGREVFEDIEDAKELAEAGYQHYLQVSRPQMLFTADVADIGDVGIGDSVMIIRREYDVYFNARIHKLSVDLLYPEDAQVELGDYKHFKESKVARKSREKNNRVQGQLSDRITRLKQEANERFDNEVAQWKSEYEQALIDVHAEIEADRENMTTLIEGTRTEFTDNLNAEITQTKEYAEQQAQEKAGVVGDKLDAFSERHESLVSGIGSDVAELKISNGNIQAAVSDANGLASTIALSPTAIDLISDEINVTGNVNISGGVTALAVDAIEGNFSRLFTSSLTTNVIKSDHIQTDTALAEKLFATNANIDELVTQTHFSNSIKTISIDAAKANFTSATASWFGADVIESSWLKVDTALFNRFTASSAFINSLTSKNAFISNIKAIDIDLNRATVTGGDGTNYIRMNNQNVMSYGTFTRSWGGETDTARLELGLFDGQIRARNLDTGYRLYLTERGLSTSMEGAIDEFTSGTLEFHSQRFNENSRGITMHSSYGAVAMVSDFSTAVIRSNLTANIESNLFSIYFRPYRQSRPGVNEFRLWVKDGVDASATDGVMSYGNADAGAASGIRFQKTTVGRPMIWATNGNGDIGTGNVRADSFIGDLEAVSDFVYAIGQRMRVISNKNDKASYADLQVRSLILEHSYAISNPGDQDVYFGVGGGELRLTNNNHYNAGNPSYRDLRLRTLRTMSSYAFENHSGGDTYFGVGGGKLLITDNNHWNGGNIGWRDIEFRNWKANSHEKYKTDISEWNLDVLDLFKELQLYQYKYRDDKENNRLFHRSILIREDSNLNKFPVEWLNGDMFNGNEVMWWNTKAIQELALENDSLKSEIAELKTQINKIMEMIA